MTILVTLSVLLAVLGGVTWIARKKEQRTFVSLQWLREYWATAMRGW